MTDFTKVENLFVDLFASSSANFSENEMQEVREFIDHGEYGLAIETFVDILKEEKKRPSQQQFDIIASIADAMSIDKGTLFRRLTKRSSIL